jgi:hypothetical protein
MIGRELSRSISRHVESILFSLNLKNEIAESEHLSVPSIVLSLYHRPPNTVLWLFGRQYSDRTRLRNKLYRDGTDNKANPLEQNRVL